jgi:hypothetical protein
MVELHWTGEHFGTFFSRARVVSLVLFKITTINGNYLGYSLSYEGEKYIHVKISKILKITGLINTIFKTSEVQKQTRIQLYNTLALPTLLYGSENWTMNE